MLSGFGYVVFLIEFAEQFLKHCSHSVIVQCRQTNIALIVKYRFIAEVYFIIGKFLYNTTQTFCFSKVIHHLTKVKFIKNVLHIFTESVEIVGKILFKS